MEQNIGDLIKNLEWREEKLGNIIEKSEKENKKGEKRPIYDGILTGGGFSRNKSSGVISAGGDHIGTDGKLRINDNNKKYISKELFDKRNNTEKGKNDFKEVHEKILKNGDILMVKDGAGSGRVCYVDQKDLDFILKGEDNKEITINEHVYIFRFDNNIVNQKFIYYYFFFLGAEKITSITSANQIINGINRGSIIELSIILTDLQTQQTIANFLDDCFDKLDNADKYLQLIFQSTNQKRGGGDVIDKNFLNTNFEEILQKYDEKIVKLEKLEKDKQKRNFENTVMKGNLIDNLWKSILEGVLGKYNTEDDDTLNNIISGFNKGKKPKNSVDPNLKPYLDLNYFRTGKVKEYLNDGLEVNKGDLVIVWDGENRGDSFIVNTNGYLSSTMSKVNLKRGNELKFLNYIFLYFKEEFKNNGVGWHLNKDYILKKSFNIPDLETQKEIVNILEKAFIYYQRMKNKAESNQKYLQNMRKGILTNIFETANLLSNQK